MKKIFRILARVIIILTVLLSCYQRLQFPRKHTAVMNRSLAHSEDFLTKTFAWSLRQHYPQFYNQSNSQFYITGMAVIQILLGLDCLLIVISRGQLLLLYKILQLLFFRNSLLLSLQSWVKEISFLTFVLFLTARPIEIQSKQKQKQQ